jgi:hypothetical protein
VEAPSPVIAEIQGRENFTTDLNEVHGYVEDIDKNKNGNLAIIVNNKAYGYNTKIDYQRFIHGETKRVDFTVAMVDTTLDGLAIITFGDRSGNDSTISVQFKAKNIDREISVTKPIVNDKIELGKYITINWISNFPEDVKLELYKEENYVLTISEGEKNTGESIYQISTVVGDGNNFRIKASSVRDTNTFAFSNYFEITKTDVKKELTLIQPNLDTAIQRGKLLKINWTENIPFLVNVDLYLDNTLVKNFLSNSNKLAFDWLIPLDMEVSDKYKIKITDVSDNTIFVESENIKILVDDASKILTFNSPNSSTAVKMETELQINWECNFQDLVNISLNRSDTSFYYSIKAFQPNTGSFIWTVPNKLLGGKMLNEGMDYYIKITQKDNSKITFRSDNFQIYRFVSVKENESNAKLIISPNPPQTELTLEIDNGELIQNIDIYNLSAEKVFSLNRLNRTKDKVDVSNLPTGKYIIEVNTSKGMLTESFVIVR